MAISPVVSELVLVVELKLPVMSAFPDRLGFSESDRSLISKDGVFTFSEKFSELVSEIASISSTQQISADFWISS